jgi:hypothetical protein
MLERFAEAVKLWFEMPDGVGFGSQFTQVSCDHRSKMVHPAAHPFIGHHDPARGKQVLDVTETRCEPEIEPDCLLDDLWRKAIVAITDFLHSPGQLTASGAASQTSLWQCFSEGCPGSDDTEHGKSVEPFSHVGVAERKMHFYACRNDNHDAFSLLASCRFTSAGLLPAGAKTRRPSSSSIAIMPSGGRTRSRKAASAGGSFAAPSARATVASCGAFRAVSPNSTRQRKTMLVAMPWRRQICATLTPGFSVSCTIVRFCSSLKQRRFDRPSTACGVKRYLRRAQLAALLN